MACPSLSIPYANLWAAGDPNSRSEKREAPADHDDTSVTGDGSKRQKKSQMASHEEERFRVVKVKHGDRPVEPPTVAQA
uniref:Uncharacterized protein n=1 Tax=Arundo donax TaxID=35708 RepID=A0A0A9BSB8_ARUDO